MGAETAGPPLNERQRELMGRIVDQVPPLLARAYREALLAEQSRFPPALHDRITRLAEESQWLRLQRELACYGDVEWIPTECYGPGEGQRALAAADLALQLAEQLIAGGG